MKNTRNFFSAVFSVSVALNSPQALTQVPVQKAAPNTQAVAPAANGVDLKSAIASAGASLGPSRLLIQKLYASRSYAPIFVSGGQPTAAAQDLKNAVASVAPQHGLLVSDYWTPETDSYFRGGLDPATSVKAELALARIYVDIAVHISTGHIAPTSIAKDIKYARQPFNGAALTAGLSGSGIAAMLNSIAPQHELYKAQQRILAKLQQIQAQGGFKALVHPKSTLKIGSNSPVVSEIKKRLQLMGYPISNTSPVYDQELANAIIDVKIANLTTETNPTGSIAPGDKVTWEYFGESSEQRLQTVEANLEKLRWLPNQLEPRHLFINLATSHLYLTDPTLDWQYDHLRDMRIINGRPTRKTPSMRDLTHDVVLNPTWGVPATVFREDKVPEIRRVLSQSGPYGLEQWFYQNRFTVTDQSMTQQIDPAQIDWFNLDPKSANFYIVQQPGYDNALGVAKVMLTNPWSIYMHDTEDRQLFPSNMRELSSGCMRMQYPLDMVEYLLRGTQWDKYTIETFVAGPGETREKETWVHIPDANRVVLYTMHLTANLGDDGVIRFTRDLYNQTNEIMAALRAAGYYKTQK